MFVTQNYQYVQNQTIFIWTMTMAFLPKLLQEAHFHSLSGDSNSVQLIDVAK